MLLSCRRGKLLGNGRAVKREAVRLGQMGVAGGGRSECERGGEVSASLVHEPAEAEEAHLHFVDEVGVKTSDPIGTN
jgi:hypothetical protein